jgi:hypothetical protein
MDPLISTEYTASTMLNTSYRAGGMHTGAVYRPALTTSTRGTELNMFSRGRGRCILETFPEISCKTCRLFYRMRQHAIQPLQADSQTAVAILWKPRCYFTHRHTQKKKHRSELVPASTLLAWQMICTKPHRYTDRITTTTRALWAQKNHLFQNLFGPCRI